MPRNLTDYARRYRAQLDAQNEAALQRLIDAYVLMYDRLQGKVDALLLQIQQEGIATEGEIFRLQRYKDLMRQIESEVNGYSHYLRTEVELGANRSIDLGLASSEQLVRALGAQFNGLPRNAVKVLLGFLDDNSPLWDRIKLLTGTQAQRVKDALIEGIGLGYNPRKIASLIQDAFGMGLTDALRTSRTVDLWSYRESARANYNANSDVITGWVWSAELDDQTCGACLAEDGSIHDLSEALDGHYNCRCAALPYVEGISEQPMTGEDWFNAQDETTQRSILGPGKYDAWQAGKFDLSALATQVNNDVYGSMTIEATLESLVGE